MSLHPDIAAVLNGDSEGCIVHGDCLQIMPDMPDGCVDAVVTDPPYGIGKAEWDERFATEWFGLVPRLAAFLALMPGTWNIGRCPQFIGDLQYKWTLAAHLTNGMTRGGIGFGNWIPCLLYQRKIPRADVVAWCVRFADWCDAHGISRGQLDAACGTSDMGGWWKSRLPHRCQVPAPHQWAKLRVALGPPVEFDALVAPSDYQPRGDCRDFVVGVSTKPAHPSPKPLNVMEWFVSCISAAIIFDPFCGSGTTCVAAKKLGRRWIGIDIDEGYCQTARNRLRDTERPLFGGIGKDNV